MKNWLASLISWWIFLWCTGGDFNVTQFPSERQGEVSFFPAVMEFSDFIFDQ